MMSLEFFIEMILLNAVHIVCVRKEEHRLRVSENRVLTKIFVARRTEREAVAVLE